MTSTLTIDRRTLLGVAAAGALASPLVFHRAVQARGKPEAKRMTSPAGMAKSFTFGAFRVSVISDGTRLMEKPQETFGIDQPPGTVSDLLAENFLPVDKFVNAFSPTLIDTGSDIVLFDTGMGAMGRQTGSGRLLDGLTMAGYTPDAVTIVVLTHMHGDHIGGLMEDGTPVFKNARYVAGQTEFDFWKDDARRGTPAEAGHALVLKNVVPLSDNMAFIGDGDEVVPGIKAMAAFGHSPGHLIFTVETEGRVLVLTADTANHFVLSLERPDWQVRFDMDKKAAAATRHKVFDQIAADRLPFIGYHMPFPSVGFAERMGDGYRFVPATYQFDV